MKNVTYEQYENSKARQEKYEEGKKTLLEGVSMKFNGRTFSEWSCYYDDRITREEMIQRIYELEQQLLTPV